MRNATQHERGNIQRSVASKHGHQPSHKLFSLLLLSLIFFFPPCLLFKFIGLLDPKHFWNWGIKFMHSCIWSEGNCNGQSESRIQIFIYIWNIYIFFPCLGFSLSGYLSNAKHIFRIWAGNGLGQPVDNLAATGLICFWVVFWLRRAIEVTEVSSQRKLAMKAYNISYCSPNYFVLPLFFHAEQLYVIGRRKLLLESAWH